MLLVFRFPISLRSRRVYQNARSTFLDYQAAGTVSKNMIAILAIITRLRQVCLHPVLTLQNLRNKRNNEGGQLSKEDSQLEKLLTAHLAGDHPEVDEDVVLSRAGLSPSKRSKVPECSQCGEVRRFLTKALARQHNPLQNLTLRFTAAPGQSGVVAVQACWLSILL